MTSVAPAVEISSHFAYVWEREWHVGLEVIVISLDFEIYTVDGSLDLLVSWD
jgi:hypothetical protein